MFVLGDLVVIHSVPARAEALAREFNSHVANYEDLAQSLHNADIVLTAYGARQYVVNSEMMRISIQRRRKRPVFLVDTSLPGDIDPSIDLIEEAFLYDLADLEGVVMDGRASRENEADKESNKSSGGGYAGYSFLFLATMMLFRRKRSD